MTRICILLALASAVALPGAVALAQHHHHDHSHDAPPPPSSYYACVKRAGEVMQRIEKALAAKNFSDVDSAGYEMLVLGKALGKAALNEASVPREKVKDVNALGRQIADTADQVHDLAASGKAETITPKVAALRPLIDRLASLVPDQYVCQMHCEEKKTYAAAGTCPVCKMALTLMSQTPYWAKVSAPGPVEAGQPTRLDIKLLDPAGNVATRIDVVHDYPLHFMLVSEDLAFYAHEHPTRQPDGTYRLSNFTFPFGGKFAAFSDFTPSGAKNQVSRFDFTVSDGTVTRPAPQKLADTTDVVHKDGDYEFRLRCNGQKFVAGQDSFLRYGIDLKGQSVKDLQVLMGEKGHLVAFSADLENYIHAHPLDFSAKPGAAHDHDHGHAHGHDHADPRVMEKAREFLLGNGTPHDVVFHAVFPKPGMFRAFAQFKHAGRVLTFPVDIDVQPGAPGSTPAKPAGHDHSHDHGDHSKPGDK